MTTLRRCRDGRVLKRLDPCDDHPPINLADLERYIETLRRRGIRLPADLVAVDVDGAVGVRHSWVAGPVLPEVASSDPDGFVAAVRRIAEWAGSLADSDARLDTNLANFVLPAHGQLTCVDVLPARFASARCAAGDDDGWARLYGALCFDTEIIVCALAGSALRVLLAVHGREHASRHVRELAALCSGHGSTDPLATSWFHTRLVVATAAADGRIPLGTANVVFDAMSIAALHGTPADERPTRINAARDLLADLDLEVTSGGVPVRMPDRLGR